MRKKNDATALRASALKIWDILEIMEAKGENWDLYCALNSVYAAIWLHFFKPKKLYKLPPISGKWR